jgi:hypothetical protein
MTVAAKTTAGARTTGYFLVNGGTNGAGVIYGTGPTGGTSHSVFLGTTEADIKSNLDSAISRLGVLGLYEANPGALASTAVAKKTAWYKTTPSDAVPDNTFTLAAATAGVGGELGFALKSVLGAAGITDAFGIDNLLDDGAENDPSTTRPSDDSAGSKAKDDSQDDESEDQNKTGTKAASAGVGLATFLKWSPLRLVKLIAGLILAVMALRQAASIAGMGNGGGTASKLATAAAAAA